MKVAYVQLLLVAGLVVVYLLSRRLGWRPLLATGLVGVGLTAFTFSAARTSGLLVLQSFVIWGTWLVLGLLHGRGKRIDDLERSLRDALSDLPLDVGRHAAAAGKAGYRVIAGREHRNVLEDALRRSRQEVIIASGWASTGVVDDRFMALLSEALARGVDVRLLFGWQSSGGFTSAGSHDKAVRRLRALADGKRGGRGRLLLHDLGASNGAAFGNHAKVLICDDDFVVCGSNNWLANRSFWNAEISVLLEQPEVVADIRRAVHDILRRSGAPGG